MKGKTERSLGEFSERAQLKPKKKNDGRRGGRDVLKDGFRKTF